jgi:hypothetical protein
MLAMAKLAEQRLKGRPEQKSAARNRFWRIENKLAQAVGRKRKACPKSPGVNPLDEWRGRGWSARLAVLSRLCFHSAKSPSEPDFVKGSCITTLIHVSPHARTPVTGRQHTEEVITSPVLDYPPEGEVSNRSWFSMKAIRHPAATRFNRGNTI